ncbi:MAG: hypothetical protein E7261_02140 [Lachnospiraceae bacterium]|nr:hypothetical protein [Lachnospiraceae bacterium]
MFDVWIEDVELTSLTINLAIAVFLPIQLLLCFKAKKRIIRLLPVIVFAVLTITFFIMAVVAQGWDGLGYLFFAIYTGITLFVCGIGWGIWWIVKLCRKNRGKV